jgi:hypothetical protein
MRGEKFTFTCEHCGTPVTQYKSSRKTRKPSSFCSRKCRSAKGLIQFACDQCGQLTTRKQSLFKRHQNHFCSQKCGNNFRSAVAGFVGQCAYTKSRGSRQVCEHGKRLDRCKKCNPTGVYKNYASGAKTRGHRFEISFEEYLTLVGQPCRYCGTHEETNGMDQVVPGEGYTLTNCVPCCTTCNRMKLDHSVEKFLHHINQIAEFQTQISF